MSIEKDKAIEFLGTEIVYDDNGQYLWSKRGDDLQMVLEVRGWGAIQHIKVEAPTTSADIQRAMGEWVAETLTAALRSEVEKSNQPTLDQP